MKNRLYECSVCGNQMRRNLFNVNKKDPELNRKWRLALNLPLEGPISPSLKICIDHFKTSDVYLTKRATKRFVMPNAVPSLNLPNSDSPATETENHREREGESQVTKSASDL